MTAAADTQTDAHASKATTTTTSTTTTSIETLLKKYESDLNDMRETENFVFFNPGLFCQWFVTEFTVGNNTYTSAEQWMMAEKARLMGDESTRALILECKIPAQCKQYGRQVKHWKQHVWNDNKLSVVYNGNYHKFSQNAELKQIILSYDTSKVFVEASADDSIWGIGLSVDDSTADDQSNWPGTNLLGICITKVRNKLLEEQEQEQEQNSSSNNNNASK